MTMQSKNIAIKPQIPGAHVDGWRYEGMVADASVRGGMVECDGPNERRNFLPQKC